MNAQQLFAEMYSGQGLEPKVEVVGHAVAGSAEMICGDCGGGDCQ
jgi:hypothetical protein